MTVINGFSKLSRDEKSVLVAEMLNNPDDFIELLCNHRHLNREFQNRYENFSENTLTNFFLPYGIAPNFLINGKIYHIPMVTEESSVVAAAAAAAKFWLKHGGFKCRVLGNIKKGQVHFEWKGNQEKLYDFFKESKSFLLKELEPYTRRMSVRGGGIRDIQLLHLPDILQNYYQLDASFDTVDAMGANFINTCLENLALTWKKMIAEQLHFSVEERECTILMSILSNYTPECIVECEVSASITDFKSKTKEIDATEFANRMVKVFRIGRMNVSRAVTHNKGILNGVDAVLIATGNDFRAVEAGAHAYASKDGEYRSLSNAIIKDKQLIIKLAIPMAVGTVGGITSLHPLAGKSMEILGQPSAAELMCIVAAVGLASNYSAVKALITGGIQKGHMKMHLSNILDTYRATDEEKKEAQKWFAGNEVSYFTVNEFLTNLRGHLL